MSLLAYHGEERRGRSVDLALRVSEGWKTKRQGEELVLWHLTSVPSLSQCVITLLRVKLVKSLVGSLLLEVSLWKGKCCG